MNLQDCEIIEKDIQYGDIGIYGNMGYEIIPCVNGIAYQNIISTHPNSSIKYKISKEHKYFSCKLALNDSSEDFASANFEIYVDGKIAHYTKNLGKFFLAHVDIILDENSEIEIKCIFNEKIICHCLWIDPILQTDSPKYLLDSISKTKINIQKFKKCSTCIVSFENRKFIHYALALKQSILKHTKEYINFVYLIDEKDQELIDLFGDDIVVPICCVDNLNISEKGIKAIHHKASTYSIAKLIDAEKYLILDIDMLCTSSLDSLFERIEITNDEIILICKDAHTDGISFGDLITSEWSAYKGSKRCKTILNLSPIEIRNENIVNGGVIAGRKKAFLSLDDSIRRLKPTSLFYLNDDIETPVREQALLNLALIKNNNFEILHKKYNLQVLWEEILIDYKQDNLRVISEEFEPNIIHFNGNESKKMLEEILLNIRSGKEFSIERVKSGRIIAEKLNNTNNIKILDIQNDDGIITSFIKTTNCKSYKIDKITNFSKIIINSFESPLQKNIEDLFLELRYLKNNSDKYHAVILGNLDTTSNIKIKLLNAVDLLLDGGLIIFNQYNNEKALLEDILSQNEDFIKLKLNETIEENFNQKIFILSK